MRSAVSSTRIESEACQGQGRAEPDEHKQARQKLTALRRGLHHAQVPAGISALWPTVRWFGYRAVAIYLLGSQASKKI